MSVVQEIFAPKKRTFVPADFQLNSWEDVEPLIQKLADAPMETAEEVESWLKRNGELEAVLNENGAWRYIRMTRDTNNADLRKDYEFFIMEILPKLTVKHNELMRKLYGAKGFSLLDPEKYKVLIRGVRNQIELFREENVALEAEHRKRARAFDEVAASMSVEINGEKVTLQKAASMLEQKDRGFRQEVWEKMTEERLKHKETLDTLLSDLIGIRTQIARNAGFDSFADYKFKDLGRFDYTRADAMAFHAAVEKVVTPEMVRRSRMRAENLGLDTLRPWDLAVDEFGYAPLKPFADTAGMLEKVILMLSRLHPQVGNYLQTMDKMGHLDLGSRLGKAPGGYNYGLQETGVPFIFMNAVGTQSDLIVMLHESGHAVHSFLTHPIEIAEFKHLPAEVAELASMSMELITMDFLDEVYTNPDDIRRARREQLLRPVVLLPWIATVDCFQFWLHDFPDHTVAEREAKWAEIFRRFHGDYVSWEGYEHVLKNFWQKQGHIYEVPFYYIEYGIAQLGSLAVWRNFCLDPVQGLENYLKALSLGYSKTIPEVYAAAGIRFDFSEANIREIVSFLGEKLDELEPRS